MLLRIKRSSNQILFFKSNMIEIYKEFNKINSGRATLCSVTSDFTLSLFSFESFNIMSTRVSSKTSGLFKWSSLSPTLYIWGRTREKERVYSSSPLQDNGTRIVVVFLTVSLSRRLQYQMLDVPKAHASYYRAAQAENDWRLSYSSIAPYCLIVILAPSSLYMNKRQKYAYIIMDNWILIARLGNSKTNL